MGFKKIALLCCVIFFSIPLLGQTKVSGMVVDAESNSPLSFVNIYAPNTKEGSTSNFEGFFSLVTNDSILVLSYTGYNPIEVKVDPKKEVLEINAKLSVNPETIICIIVSSSLHKALPSVATLDKRDLQQNNETNIAPALNTIPGVFMHSGGLNTNRITIRGIGNRNLFGTAKIKAYLEGIPLTDGSGESSIEDIELSILESVTVYKGPASSIYGAGLGGMIRLEVPDDINRNGTAFSVKSTGGSYGLARNTLTFSRANYNKSVFHLNANITNSDGYRANNKYYRGSATGFGKFNINEKEVVNLLFNYTYLNAQIPSSLDSTDYVANPGKAAYIWGLAKGSEITERALMGISYKANIGKHVRQISSINGSFRNSYEVRPFNILREHVTTLGARSEWIYQHNDFEDFLSNFEFHIGGELFAERYFWQTYDTDGEGSRGDILSDNQERRNYSNAFAQVNLDFNYLVSLTLGLNRNFTFYNFNDFYKLDGNQGSSRRFPYTWSPFLNIGVNLDDLFHFKNELALSATISHGFSPPKLEESLGPNGRINREILPEQGWNYELGLRGSIDHRFNYAFSFYSMQIKDLLVAKRTGFNQFIGINAGKTQHNGIEVTLDYQWDFKGYQIKPFLNYTYADYVFKEFIDGDFDYSGNDLTGTAPHLFSTGASWTNDNFYGNIIYRFVDAMPMRDDNSIYSDAYQLVDLKLGYKRIFERKWEVNFFAGINNVFDEKYASMILINAGSFGTAAPRYYYPGLPRNFYLGVEVSFGE